MNICILAAGTGSRMQKLFPQIPKLMIPICGKTVLEHQLEQIPRNWKITIVVAYASQLIDYQIQKYFADRDINLIVDNNPLQVVKGPAGSLLACRQYLTAPFWLLFSDTIWFETLPELNENTLFVGQYKSQKTERFCNVKFGPDLNVEAIFDKVSVAPSLSIRPFVGLAYIKDAEAFLLSLAQDEVREDQQLTRGFETLITKGLKIQPLESWQDVGTPESYAIAEQELKLK
jgi:NDP-sugar pyrophosphorylase family protein